MKESIVMAYVGIAFILLLATSNISSIPADLRVTLSTLLGGGIEIDYCAMYVV